MEPGRRGDARGLCLRSGCCSKLETESQALEGKVFDVLGALFEQTPLRKLLVEAIRYGDQPEVRARLEQAVDNAVDRERVRELLEARSLATESMDITQIAAHPRGDGALRRPAPAAPLHQVLLHAGL